MSNVVTMTSWKKRINSVGQFIFTFYKTQTKVPDYFYLWLSETEFPNRERDLPSDLLAVCKYFNVIIKWVPYNDGCTKRWNVYPDHYEDTVVAIDEDAIYDSLLVESMNKITEYTGKIYTVWDSLNNYLVPEHSIEFSYRNYRDIKQPNHSLRIKLSGNSVVPPNTFPLDALNPKYLQLRLRYCPRCDESWLMPFYRYNGIESQTLGLAKRTLEDCFRSSGISSNGKRIKGIWWKNWQIYIVLRLFPHLMDKWKMIFPTYNDDMYRNINIDTLVKDVL